MIPQDCDILWWDAFCTEFFEEDATLTLSVCLEEGPKTYSKCVPGCIHQIPDGDTSIFITVFDQYVLNQNIPKQLHLVFLNIENFTACGACVL